MITDREGGNRNVTTKTNLGNDIKRIVREEEEMENEKE